MKSIAPVPVERLQFDKDVMCLSTILSKEPKETNKDYIKAYGGDLYVPKGYKLLPHTIDMAKGFNTFGKTVKYFVAREEVL
jgi:hypothetical protein